MFELSKNIDPNKVFLISRSELTQRFDPTSYKLVFNFKSNKFPIYKLSEIAFINPSTSFSKLDDDFEISFVPMEAVSDKNGVIKKYQTKKISESNGFTRFKENDLIWAKITPCMQNGKSAVIRNTINGYACGSTEFYIIRPKNKNLLIDYVHFLLRDERVLNNAQNYFGGSAGQQRVSKDFLLNFKIPVPPIEIQQQIVEKINNAYTQKQQKENQAKELLKSIDSYLLNELGITLPTKNNSLQNRIFTTSYSEVSGGRFDPKLYDNTTIGLKKAIKNVDEAKFKTLPLKHFISQSVAGDWGFDENESAELDLQKYQKCLVIRATEFDNDFNLKLENSRVKYRLIKKEKIQKIDIRENDLLIEKSGGSPDQPVGRIALITKDILDNNTICYSNFIHKIRVDSTVLSPEYLFCFLKTIHNIKLTEAMQSQTNGIRNLIMATYFNQTIVIPIKNDGSFDLNKQNEIANHIQGLRAKAKQLQEEAKVILDDAKQEVEKMILG